jgi:hypothetical protein
MDDFHEAAADYRFLLDRGYPERACLKIIGDRRRLSAEERLVLYRGICSADKAASRRTKLFQRPDVLPLPDKALVIDGYNVLFTLMNYRLGKNLFISSDGFLRDSGGVQGRIKNEKVFDEVTRVFLDFRGLRLFSGIQIVLDSPVSFSALHRQVLESGMQDRGLKGSCSTAASADFAVKEACALQPKGAIAVTSDSAIIDSVHCPVLDLEATWQPDFINLATK